MSNGRVQDNMEQQPYQDSEQNQHYQDMCDECVAVCLLDMDIEEEMHIHCHQKFTNLEVQSQVGNTRNTVQIIMERKLSLFGHLCRMEDKRLVKCVVFGIMEGWTRRGRPSREWLDDIKE